MMWSFHHILPIAAFTFMAFRLQPGKDAFGCDPFAVLHAPTAASAGGPPPRPESPSPALPPKKSKQPPPRPAPPRPAQVTLVVELSVNGKKSMTLWVKLQYFGPRARVVQLSHNRVQALTLDLEQMMHLELTHSVVVQVAADLLILRTLITR